MLSQLLTSGERSRERKMGSQEGRVSVPVGFRFHPTEEELVDHYLKGKMEDQDFQDGHIMPEIDVCRYDPGDLPAMLSTEPDSPYHDMECFFFSPRDYKYTNSTRSNRATPNGYWKITGKERMIKARRSKAVIGKKRTLTFYMHCKPKAKKTNWVMHQYNRTQTVSVQRDFVLCRVRHKADKKDTTICDGGRPSCSSVSNHEDHAAANVTLESPTNTVLGDVLQTNGINDNCAEMQSPFGDNHHSVTDKNDISTCDEGQSVSYTAADDMIVEPFALPEINPILPYHGHDYCSSTSQSLLSASVPHDNVFNAECRMWTSTFPVNLSTGYDDEQVGNTASNFENQATYENTFEGYPQPEEYLEFLFCPPQLEDYTLSPLMSTSAEDDFHNWSTSYDDDQVSNTASNFENQAIRGISSTRRRSGITLSSGPNDRITHCHL